MTEYTDNDSTRQRLARIWRDWRGFILFIAVMVVFRSAVADWNQVPSGSMKPSILIGDRIVVDKLAYDLRIPFTLIRIARWSEPHRGDVVTFPIAARRNAIRETRDRRAGRHRRTAQNRLYINGVEAQYTPLDALVEVAALEVENKTQYEFYREQIGTMDHVIMLRRDRDESTYQSFPPTQSSGRPLSACWATTATTAAIPA